MNLVLTWLIGGIAVAAVATLAARIIPSSSPAQRHAFWWMALVSIVVMPWLPGLVGTAATLSVSSGAGGEVASGASMMVVPAPPSWLPTVAIGAWALVACASLLRLVVNLRAVRRLADAALPLPAEHAGRLRRFVDARAGSRAATVCVSAEIRGACAVGFVHPRVLLSADLVAMLDDRAIEAIVLHEYAHLQRYDDWTRLVQRCVIALFGLHPAVRWVSRHIDIEREASCDRLVVARVGAPLAYARALASAAEISARMNGLSAIAAPGASGAGGGFHARVARLVASAPVRPRLAWVASLAGTAGLGLATVGAVAMPPLVGVQGVAAPLRALASMPLRSMIVREFPGVSAAPLLASSEEQAPRVEVPSITAVSDSTQAAPGIVADTIVMDDAHINRDEHVESRSGVESHSVESHSSAAEPPVLAATSAQVRTLAVPAGPVLLDTRIPSRISEATWLGVATGDVAAKAGTSVGRFFKNGGLAIASRF